MKNYINAEINQKNYRRILGEVGKQVSVQAVEAEDAENMAQLSYDTISYCTTFISGMSMLVEEKNIGIFKEKMKNLFMQQLDNKLKMAKDFHDGLH